MGAAVMEDGGFVRDGKILTGRAAGSAFAFGLGLIEALCGTEVSEKIATEVVYS